MKVAAAISPVVGDFHPCFPPGSEPFVAVGDLVTQETIVAVVLGCTWFDDEKNEYYNGLVVNRIKAGVEGTIIAMIAKPGETVEYRTPLFAIRPKNPFGSWHAIDWPLE